VKSLLAALLAPLAHLAGAWERLARLWAFARLRAELPGRRLDASNVVLGPAELRGSRRIRLGRRLFLYRELYLETQGSGEITIATASSSRAARTWSPSPASASAKAR
jgi:hypothetical protein